MVKKIRNILTKILRLNPGLGIRDTADPLIDSYFSHLQLKSIIGNKFHSPFFSSKGYELLELQSIPIVINISFIYIQG